MPVRTTTDDVASRLPPRPSTLAVDAVIQMAMTARDSREESPCRHRSEMCEPIVGEPASADPYLVTDPAVLADRLVYREHSRGALWISEHRAGKPCKKWHPDVGRRNEDDPPSLQSFSDSGDDSDNSCNALRSDKTSRGRPRLWQNSGVAHPADDDGVAFAICNNWSNAVHSMVQDARYSRRYIRENVTPMHIANETGGSEFFDRLHAEILKQLCFQVHNSTRIAGPWSNVHLKRTTWQRIRVRSDFADAVKQYCESVGLSSRFDAAERERTFRARTCIDPFPNTDRALVTTEARIAPCIHTATEGDLEELARVSSKCAARGVVSLASLRFVVLSRNVAKVRGTQKRKGKQRICARIPSIRVFDGASWSTVSGGGRVGIAETMVTCAESDVQAVFEDSRFERYRERMSLLRPAIANYPDFLIGEIARLLLDGSFFEIWALKDDGALFAKGLRRSKRPAGFPAQPPSPWCFAPPVESRKNTASANHASDTNALPDSSASPTTASDGEDGSDVLGDIDAPIVYGFCTDAEYGGAEDASLVHTPPGTTPPFFVDIEHVVSLANESSRQTPPLAIWRPDDSSSGGLWVVPRNMPAYYLFEVDGFTGAPSRGIQTFSAWAIDEAGMPHRAIVFVVGGRCLHADGDHVIPSFLKMDPRRAREHMAADAQCVFREPGDRTIARWPLEHSEPKPIPTTTSEWRKLMNAVLVRRTGRKGDVFAEEAPLEMPRHTRSSLEERRASIVPCRHKLIDLGSGQLAVQYAYAMRENCLDASDDTLTIGLPGWGSVGLLPGSSGTRSGIRTYWKRAIVSEDPAGRKLPKHVFGRLCPHDAGVRNTMLRTFLVGPLTRCAVRVELADSAIRHSWDGDAELIEEMPRCFVYALFSTTEQHRHALFVVAGLDARDAPRPLQRSLQAAWDNAGHECPHVFSQPLRRGVDRAENGGAEFRNDEDARAYLSSVDEHDARRPTAVCRKFSLHAD